jgi:hypothetical protein
MGGGHMMGGQGMMEETEQSATTKESSSYYMGPAVGYGMGPGMMGYGICPGYGGYGMMGGMGYGMMGMMPNMMMGGMGYGMMGMGPGMMGYGMGPGMMGYGAGYVYSKEFQKFLDETRDLRKELNEKNFEYFEALRNPNTKPDTIKKLQNELFELRNKIYEKSPWKGYGWYGGHPCKH